MTEEKRAKVKKVLEAIKKLQDGGTLQSALQEKGLSSSEFFLTVEQNAWVRRKFRKAKELAIKYLLEQAFGAFQDGISARTKEHGVTGDVLRAAVTFLGSDGTFSSSQKLEVEGTIALTAGLAELAKALEERKGNRTDEK